MRHSGYERGADDWYQEGADAVVRLIEAHRFEGPIWDPACGEGNIPIQFARAGFETMGSDIMDRGYGAHMDFFDVKPDEHTHVRTIVSNPPFGIMERWARHAVQIAQTTALLGRLAFLESERRREFFDEMPLQTVLVSRKRISMPPGGRGIVAKGGSIPFAWFIFEQGHSGPATIGWC